MAVLPALATWTVKEAVSPAVAVPVIAPPVESVSPAGSEPDASVHEYEPSPPLAWSVSA